MVSKNQIKLISSLHQKKHRQTHQLFIAEGIKGIQELLDAHFELEHLYTTQTDFETVAGNLKTLVTDADLKKMSALASPNTCLAVFKIPEVKAINSSGLIVALDDIRDPGNLGTILRLCDWFGIQQLICSKETVDVYNPKVVQASMGSVFRLPVHYTDIEVLLSNEFVQLQLPVVGATLSGGSLYDTSFAKDMIIVFGNESRGVSPKIHNLLKQSIKIDSAISSQAESLNVSAAVSVICSEYLRQNRG